MKKTMLIAALLIAALLLTGCGSRDDGAAKTAARQAAGDAQAEASTAEAPTSGGGEAAQSGQSEAEKTAAVPEGSTGASADEERPVDLDLTKISGTVVYSQVYDMMAQPENYLGRKVRMKGNFSYYQDPATKQEYFAAVIADATACCAQGIEFVWAGEHAYPQDYPPLDTEVTVTGIFNTYYEGKFMYVQLADAAVSWQ